MIVLDASAMVEALVGVGPSDKLFEFMTGNMHAPHLIDVEVSSVLRGLELGKVVTAEQAVRARDDFWSFTLMRHDFEPLADRVWQLRHQFTSYDASYIALAEALGAPLVTCDRKLATRAHWAQVEVVAPAQ